MEAFGKTERILVALVGLCSASTSMALLSSTTHRSKNAFFPRSSTTGSGLHSSRNDYGVFEDNEWYAESRSTSTISQDPYTVPIGAPPMTRSGEGGKLAIPKQSRRYEDGEYEYDDEEMYWEGEEEEDDGRDSVWERNKPVEVQGGSLRSWSFSHHKIDMVQVHMKTNGRPMNANVELWSGPDNTPQKVAVYSDDGLSRPFRAFVATPSGQNSVSIRNTNTLEYPLEAVLEAGQVDAFDAETTRKMRRVQRAKPRQVQGDAVITRRFEPDVQSIQVFLQSEGRPLHCRIELLQGPNTVKQCMEVYTEEGSARPFYAILETPGPATSVMRIVNSGSLAFPFEATVVPWDIETIDYRALPDGNDPNSDNPFFVITGDAEGVSTKKSGGYGEGMFGPKKLVHKKKLPPKMNAGVRRRELSRPKPLSSKSSPPNGDVNRRMLSRKSSPSKTPSSSSSPPPSKTNFGVRRKLMKSPIPNSPPSDELSPPPPPPHSEKKAERRKIIDANVFADKAFM